MKTKALDYQIKVLNKIKDLNSFALFMDYGTGKSYCTLAWIEKNKHKLKNGVLIIAKKTNILDTNAWPTEIDTHTNFSYYILEGSRKNKLERMSQKPRADIYLLSYESVLSIFKQIIQRKFSAVFLDESTKVKNITARVTKRIMKIAETISNRGVLTGFPVTEQLDDIWSQFYMVDLGQALTDNYYKFKYKYFHRWRFGWTINKGKDEEIIKRISDRSVFIKINDCIDLPPIINKYVPIIPTKKQIKYMDELKKDFSLTIDKDTVLEYMHILPVLAKQQQICNGFLYDKRYPNNAPVIRFGTPKDDVLLDLIEEILYKKIIWCKHIEEVVYLTELIRSPTHHVRRMCSSDSSKEQQRNLYDFKHDKQIKTLITTYALLESGETLAMCNYNIHYSYVWSNSMFRNAKARTYRKGSEIHDKVVYIHLYLKGTIEEVILDALKKKQSLQRKLKSYMEKWLWD